MAKIRNQIIPSEFLDEYDRPLTPAYSTGFQYYIHNYPYAIAQIVRTQMVPNLKCHMGLSPAYLTRYAARYRVAFSRATDIFRLQPFGGPIPPLPVGPRSRVYWYNLSLPFSDSYLSYFMSLTTFYTVDLYKPEWGINPILHVVDSLNHRIQRFDVNSFKYVDQEGSQGAAGDQLDTPTRAHTDLENIYIADTGNNRVVIWNKFNFAQVGTISTFDGPPGTFSNLLDVNVDDNYIYCADSGLHKIIILDKQSYKYIKAINVTLDIDSDEAEPTCVSLDPTYIYITDKKNHRLKIFHRDTALPYKVLLSEGSGPDQVDTPWSVETDIMYIYVCDTENDRIIKIDKYLHNQVESIGKNETNFFDLNKPKGITIAGGYLLVADTENNRIIRILKTHLTEPEIYGKYGVGRSEYNSPIGIEADIKNYWG